MLLLTLLLHKLVASVRRPVPVPKAVSVRHPVALCLVVHKLLVHKLEVSVLLRVALCLAVKLVASVLLLALPLRTVVHKLAPQLPPILTARRLARRSRLRPASLINRSIRSAEPWWLTPARSIRTASLRKVASAVLRRVVRLAVNKAVPTVVPRRKAVATVVPRRKAVATVVPRRAVTVVLRRAGTARLIRTQVATVVPRRAATAVPRRVVRRRAVNKAVATVVLRLAAHKATVVLRKAGATALSSPHQVASGAACPAAAHRWFQWAAVAVAARLVRHAIR